MRVSKKDLAKQLAVQGYYKTKKEALMHIDTILAAISVNLAEGNEIHFPAFGKFEVLKPKETKTRKGTKVPKFRPFKFLKDSVVESSN